MQVKLGYQYKNHLRISFIFTRFNLYHHCIMWRRFGGGGEGGGGGDSELLLWHYGACVCVCVCERAGMWRESVFCGRVDVP